MDIEIIKTDKPDIVIERTTTEKEINISHIREHKENFKNVLLLINDEITELEISKEGVSDIIVEALNNKINNLFGEKVSIEYQISLLDNILING